jgi:hypothetical protein
MDFELNKEKQLSNRDSGVSDEESGTPAVEVK